MQCLTDKRSIKPKMLHRHAMHNLLISSNWHWH